MAPDTDLSPDWKKDIFCRIGETTYHNRNGIFKFYLHCRIEIECGGLDSLY